MMFKDQGASMTDQACPEGVKKESNSYFFFAVLAFLTLFLGSLSPMISSWL